MRSFRHWTPRYIRDRLFSNLYRRAHPDHPWLTPAAIDILACWLKDSDVGLEFGSGMSTLWFAKRVRRLTSVEHDQAWHRKVVGMLEENNLANVDYRHVPRDPEGGDGAQAAYVRQAEGMAAHSLDFALVDGIYRDQCCLAVLDLLRPGGMLVIDNVNKYLPSRSQAPNSRSMQDGPKGAAWEIVSQKLAGWRMIWTSSGVWDTALYLKPSTL